MEVFECKLKWNSRPDHTRREITALRYIPQKLCLSTSSKMYKYTHHSIQAFVHVQLMYYHSVRKEGPPDFSGGGGGFYKATHGDATCMVRSAESQAV